MDTIKNYLETMFLNLPNTTEVLRAKSELRQMMEDKYNELIAEGKPENEAVGTVLSEFGNLDELAETLGISNYMNINAIDRRLVTLNEAFEYIALRAKHALFIAIGVALCILSPTGFIYGDAYNNSDVYGLVFMFTCVAVAVGLFIYSGQTHSAWMFLQKTPCAVEFATIDQLNSEKNRNRNFFIALRIIAVVSAILGVGFEAVIDEIPGAFGGRDFGGIAFFIGAAICASLCTYAGVREASYVRLLSLNDSHTVGGNYVDGQRGNKRITKTGRAILSVYWPTVTCLYFIISFLTFQWQLTWLIWVIGAILHNLIGVIFEEKND